MSCTTMPDIHEHPNVPEYQSEPTFPRKKALEKIANKGKRRKKKGKHERKGGK